MTIDVMIILGATLFLAYSNGSNDNFKGVATLWGSGTTDYKKALSWATVTTLAGSMTAAFFATQLANIFSGKGLVPDTLISSPDFLVAVMLGAGITVFLATTIGIPVSTTHSLTGALVGTGLVTMGTDLGFQTLGNNFIYPLLLSPFLALAFAGSLYLVIASSASWEITVDQKKICAVNKTDPDGKNRWGIRIQKFLNSLHFFSAGSVGFARGMNDTPKIVAIALAAETLHLTWLTFLAASLMALGGILQSRKIALTMSHHITPMTHGQGLTANLVTSILVIFASKWGIPVSTTHVSCGSLFGIGLVNGQANWKGISSIVFAWALTLPLAAVLSALTFAGLH